MKLATLLLVTGFATIGSWIYLLGPYAELFPMPAIGMLLVGLGLIRFSLARPRVAA